MSTGTTKSSGRSGRGGFAILLLLLACALPAACGKSDWSELTIPEGGFRVLMRSEPHYVKQELDTPAGKMTAFLYSSDRVSSYYAVGYSDYPLALVVGTDPAQIFSGVRDTWVRRIGGRLVRSDSKLKLGGSYPGLEFEAEGRANGADAFVQARIYMVEQRLYQVIAMGRKNEVPQGEINRFLDSFRLVPVGETRSLEIRPEGK
jgi:hypothetical protein